MTIGFDFSHRMLQTEK